MPLKSEGKGPIPPLLKQYVELRDQHPDYLVLFQVGDFYECFGEDAERLARALNLILTHKSAKDFTTPMAGLPLRSVDANVEKLLKQGIRVAIADQVQSAADAEGLVKREVTQLMTPGTVTDEKLLKPDANYVAGVATGDGYGLTLLDVSTGEFRGTHLYSKASLYDELQRYNPAEVLLAPELYEQENFRENFSQRFSVMLTQGRFENAEQALMGHFTKLPGGLRSEALLRAAGAVLSYAIETQRGKLPQVTGFTLYDPGAYMNIGEVALATLEVFDTRLGEECRTLFAILDDTRTAPGRRLLQAWLRHPLLDKDLIAKRLDAVEALVIDSVLRQDLRKALFKMNDLERLATRLAAATAGARELVALARSLSLIPEIKVLLADRSEVALQSLNERLKPLTQVSERVEAALVEDPPIKITEGGLLQDGVDKELDLLREKAKAGRSWISELESKERAATNIPTLKIGFNGVFGYYLEVTRPYYEQVPETYRAIQTLKDRQRYTRNDLREKEREILRAEDSAKQREHIVFDGLRQELEPHAEEVRAVGAVLAELDVFTTLADIAAKRQYCRPIFTNDGDLDIRAGRHPVVEQYHEFIPNDLHMSERERLLVLTGPNMSGKCVSESTLVFSQKGVVPIGKLKPKLSKENTFTKLGVCVKGKEGLQPATYFYQGGQQKTLCLTTRLGYSIEATPEHRLWVRHSDGTEGWKHLSDVAIGDTVAIERNINLWGNDITIECPKARALKNVKRYPLPEELSEDLAYLMGLFVGDGTLTYANSICLSTADEFIASEFKRIAKQLFNYEPRYKNNNKDYYISSQQIRVFFAELGLGYCKANTKRVPYSILQAPRHIVITFLQGLFDADGFVEKRYGNIEYSTSSRGLSKEVHLLLLNLGIIASLRKKETPCLPSYPIGISGADAITFHTEVGFRLPRKRQRSKLASSIRRPNIGGIPHLQSTLRAIHKRIVTTPDKPVALKRNKSVVAVFDSYLPRERNPSYAKLKEVINYYKQNAVDCTELENIVNKGYLYLPVVNIEESKAEVCDLSVKKDHAYIANGFVSHNSTYLRQSALVVLLAQIGSFVPAEEAKLPIFERIYTRIGAADDIAGGRSTFMVEMDELGHILQHATTKSLILLDEIGRGTSTYDGLSLAWAASEYLHNKVKAFTLFATHYFELTSLANKLPAARNYHVAAKEEAGGLVFYHQVLEGPASKSYGLQVAKLAGLPNEVLERAFQVMAGLESSQNSTDKDIIDAILGQDLNQVSPLGALELLHKLQEKVKGLGETHE